MTEGGILPDAVYGQILSEPPTKLSPLTLPFCDCWGLPKASPVIGKIQEGISNQDSDHESLKQLIENIRKWQECLPDSGKPVEETPLSDLQFSALFLQHPFTAMPLWNVMQRFYALDRLVCATSKESLEKISEWEEMPLFKYLEAGKVEKRWRNSLQELGRGIKESSKQEEAPLSPESERSF